MITVRQLEAIIRISEAVAKVTLSPVATEEHVDEAIRLFRFSTLNAVESGNIEGMTRGELQEEVQRLEREIMRRLPLGWTTSYARLRNEFVDKQRYSFVRIFSLTSSTRLSARCTSSRSATRSASRTSTRVSRGWVFEGALYHRRIATAMSITTGPRGRRSRR